MQSFLNEQLPSDDNIDKYLSHTSYRGMGIPLIGVWGILLLHIKLWRKLYTINMKGYNVV